MTETQRERAIRIIKTFRNPPKDFVGISLEDAARGEKVRILLYIDEELTKFLFDIREEELI